MLSITLALVLSATPAPAVESWAKKACPLPKKEPQSNVEYKAQEGARAECLKKAMNKALDKVIVPLKKKDAANYKAWMGLQADYNRWVADACAAVEEAYWVDTATGERSMGTGYGSAEMQCRQGQYAWRGFYADAWARNDWQAITKALDEYAKVAPKHQELLAKFTEQAKAAAERAPAQVEQSDTPMQKLSKSDWKDYNDRLDRAASAPKTLAERQCALVPKAPATCADSFRASLFSQMDLSEVMGRPSEG
ncbi:hypothetical protein [Hyalangium rubrum]|uniref:Lysozyme inhibitor LprI N-terminal domain-containing protein n=1 Tax=Hyalangium rubrum TaxID=3103134 RepID=A0ABU5HEL4_9BACT|nr:hypothetical protein [Hyalangium sp. s54d21]MDY7231314.1 hypothetical protein [Hyalangium sp. s54d21]